MTDDPESAEAGRRFSRVGSVAFVQRGRDPPVATGTRMGRAGAEADYLCSVLQYGRNYGDVNEVGCRYIECRQVADLSTGQYQSLAAAAWLECFGLVVHRARSGGGSLAFDGNGQSLFCEHDWTAIGLWRSMRGAGPFMNRSTPLQRPCPTLLPVPILLTTIRIVLGWCIKFPRIGKSNPHQVFDWHPFRSWLNLAKAL